MEASDFCLKTVVLQNFVCILLGMELGWDCFRQLGLPFVALHRGRVWKIPQVHRQRRFTARINVGAIRSRAGGPSASKTRASFPPPPRRRRFTRRRYRMLQIATTFEMRRRGALPSFAPRRSSFYPRAWYSGGGLGWGFFREVQIGRHSRPSTLTPTLSLPGRGSC
jgi:hypothetical protein